VHNTPMDQDIRQFYEALFDVIGLLQQPQRDVALLAEAGVSLDRALFPLVVLIGRRGTVGIVELAGLVGRDYTTVSRQVAKLERLELVRQGAGSGDRREHKVTATQEGLAIKQALDGARERLLHPILAHWTEQDWKTFVSFLRRFADDALAFTQNGTDDAVPQ
jgi:DNA-binding MarR family transcriptional regulator